MTLSLSRALPPLFRAPFRFLRTEWTSLTPPEHEKARERAPRGVVKAEKRDDDPIASCCFVCRHPSMVHLLLFYLFAQARRPGLLPLKRRSGNRVNGDVSGESHGGKNAFSGKRKESCRRNERISPRGKKVSVFPSFSHPPPPPFSSFSRAVFFVRSHGHIL